MLSPWAYIYKSLLFSICTFVFFLYVYLGFFSVFLILILRLGYGVWGERGSVYVWARGAGASVAEQMLEGKQKNQ